MSKILRHRRLQRRAEMLARLRAFFSSRGFLEVETPLVDAEIIPELHIEPFAAREAPLFLQASPELHMKRLLCEGLPAIYQTTRSFRHGERGTIHNPEFTIVEWYRAGDDMAAGMALLDELCQMIADAPAARRTTYAEAFRLHAGVVDAHCATCDELRETAKRMAIAIPNGIDVEDRDQWLNLLLAMAVEPRLGVERPEMLYDYPASQAALSATTTRDDDRVVAERFELYWRGVELANGYRELTDAAALRSRLEEVNRRRTANGRPPLPLPERMLAAMIDPGLPACSGCALGFDRLVMLACGAVTIDDVMAFSW